MEDYKIKYELLSEENKTLRSIIENLISEKCKLSTELKYIRSGSIEKKDIQYDTISDIDDEKIFSEDCCESIQELLKLFID